MGGTDRCVHWLEGPDGLRVEVGIELENRGQRSLTPVFFRFFAGFLTPVFLRFFLTPVFRFFRLTPVFSIFDFTTGFLNPRIDASLEYGAGVGGTDRCVHWLEGADGLSAFCFWDTVVSPKWWGVGCRGSGFGVG